MYNVFGLDPASLIGKMYANEGLSSWFGKKTVEICCNDVFSIFYLFKLSILRNT